VPSGFRNAKAWREGRLDSLPSADLAAAILAEHDPESCRTAFDTMRRTGAWYVPTHVTREEDARAGEPAFRNDPRLDYLDPLSRWAFRDGLDGTLDQYPGERGRTALRAYFAHACA
jgi:hypothetical protein